MKKSPEEEESRSFLKKEPKNFSPWSPVVRQGHTPNG
jgi:hypothetical protein